MEYQKFNIDATMKTEIEGKKYTWRQLTLDDLIINETRFPLTITRNQKGITKVKNHDARIRFAIFWQISENVEGFGKDWKEKVPLNHKLMITAESQKFTVSEWEDFQSYYPDLKPKDTNSPVIYAVSKQSGISIPHVFTFKPITENHYDLYQQIIDFTDKSKGKKRIITSDPKAKQLNDLFDTLIISATGYCVSDEKTGITPQMTPAYHKQEVIGALFAEFSTALEDLEGN
jgi:hypothetical protein